MDIINKDSSNFYSHFHDSCECYGWTNDERGCFVSFRQNDLGRKMQMIYMCMIMKYVIYYYIGKKENHVRIPRMNMNIEYIMNDEAIAMKCEQTFYHKMLMCSNLIGASHCCLFDKHFTISHGNMNMKALRKDAGAVDMLLFLDWFRSDWFGLCILLENYNAYFIFIVYCHAFEPDCLYY